MFCEIQWLQKKEKMFCEIPSEEGKSLMTFCLGGTWLLCVHGGFATEVIWSLQECYKREPGASLGPDNTQQVP